MNVWKVILATLVIYSAGLVTGSLLVRQRAPLGPPPGVPPGGPPMFQPWFLQRQFLERMRVELGLSREQTERLERVFADSRERIRMINDLVRPEMQAELRSTREKVARELTPMQRRRFEELMRSRPNRPGEGPIPPRLREMRSSPRENAPAPSNQVGTP